MRAALSFIVAISALVSFTSAAGGHNDKRGHKGVFRRLNATNETHTLEKRGFSGRWTYFADGLGACGQWNKPSDFIVALNTPQYGGGSPGPQCFKMITMSYGGKTTQAQIMDECPTCGWGELDLSEGLFSFFADTSLGEINGNWWFGGGDGGGNNNPPPPPPPPPKPTTTQQAPPAWTPPAKTSSTQDNNDDPTSTPKARVQTSSSASKTSTKKKPSSTSTSKTSSVNFNSGVGAGLAEPTGSPVAANSSYATGALNGLNQAIINIGSLISAGGQ